MLAKISNQIATLSASPDFILYEGDLQDSFDLSTINLWDDALNGNSNNGNLDKIALVRGNHDEGGWENHYIMSDKVSKFGGVNYSEMPGQENLTYSFDYANSHFVGIDNFGDNTQITTDQISWAEQSITGAESRGLSHVFLYFHGPLYYTGAHPVDINPDLVTLINDHPIISAIFVGHEHVMAYNHLDSNHIPGLTRSIEQFLTGNAGANTAFCDESRILEGDFCSAVAGFATIDVNGSSYTVNYYQEGIAEPLAELGTFTSSYAPQLPTVIPTITPPEQMVSQPTSNNNSGYSAPPCNDPVPPGRPEIFQTTWLSKDSVRLSFAPVNRPVTYYYIAYGLQDGDERWGTQFEQGFSGGALNYVIGSLDSKTKYYFKIRAGNGCMPGNWSDWISTKYGFTDSIRLLFQKNKYKAIPNSQTKLTLKSTTNKFSVDYLSYRKLYQDKESAGDRYTLYYYGGSFAVHVGKSWSWKHSGRSFNSAYLIDKQPTFRYDIEKQTIVDIQNNGLNYTLQCVHNNLDNLKSECENFLSSFRFL